MRSTLAVLALLLATPSLAATAPLTISQTSVQALPHPYDEDADAHALLKAAQDQARATGKRILIDFGANWCGDCKVLAAVLDLPEVKRFVAANYLFVQVDVARFKKNLDIAESYGLSLHEIPSMLVVDASGTVLNRTEATALGDARTMTPQAIADQLVRWAGTPAS